MKTIIGLYSNNNTEQVIKYILNGFSLHGWKTEAYSYDSFKYKKCDLCVSMGWKKGYVNSFFKLYKNNFLFIDASWIRPEIRVSEIDTVYIHMSYNGIGAYGKLNYNSNLPDDRWKVFDIGMIPRSNGSKILIAHQNGPSVIGEDRHAFYKNIIDKLNKANIKYTFCYHPINATNLTKSKYFDSIKSYNIKGETVVGANNILSDAFCVITYDSSVSANSIIKGVPSYVATKSLTFPITDKNPKSIKEFVKNPYFPNDKERQEWYNWLSYQQWNYEELNNGTYQEYFFNEHKEYK